MILDRFDQLKELGTTPDGDTVWSACCPVPGHGKGNGDQNPSLSIFHTPGTDRYRYHCQAQCSPEDIAAAIGDIRQSVDTHTPRKLESKPSAIYLYEWPDGTVEYRVCRSHYLEPGGGKSRDKTFRQQRWDSTQERWIGSVAGVTRLMFNLPQLHGMESIPLLYFVEGEKDALRLREGGHAATCISGGSSGKLTEAQIEQIQTLQPQAVRVIRDKDEPGRKFANRICRQLQEKGIVASVVESPVGTGQDGADVSDHLDSGASLDDLVPVESNPIDDPIQVMTWPGNCGTHEELAGYLVEHLNGELIYCEDLEGGRNKWAVYESGVFLRGDAEARARVGRLFVERWEACELAGAPRWVLTALRTAQNKAAISGAMEAAQSRLRVRLEDLGDHVHCELLNVINGVVNLRTMELLPHSPDYRFMLRCPVSWDPDADCPLWTEAMTVWQPDSIIRNYLQAIAGVATTGKMEQAVYCNHGSGSNGKSAFINTIATVLGDSPGGYSSHAQIETFMACLNRSGDKPRPELVRLRAQRMIASSEVTTGGLLDESMIKAWTGGEQMTHRGLHVDASPWKPQGSIFFGTNAAPGIRDSSDGIWRRMRFIKWGEQIPESMKRDNVWDWLAEQEGPGILRWLVQGASDYLTNGMMPTPSSIEDATKSYRLREDWLGQFLIENVVECPGHTVTKDALYRVYSHWCENGGLKPLGKIKLGTALVERKGWSMECRDTAGNRAWDEIALVNPDLLIDLS